MEKLAILVFALVGCLPLACTYPSGAPDESCADMFPHHDIDSQMSAAPFTIRVLQDSYQPGQNVTVHIEANSEAWFEGFFLQARRAACEMADFEVPVGQFFTNDHEVKLKTCPRGSTNNAVTHSSKAKKHLKTVTWVNTLGGDVFFQATMVQEYDEFWAGVKSNVLSDSTSPSTGPYMDCPVRTRYHQVSMSAPLKASLSTVALIGAALFVL